MHHAGIELELRDLGDHLHQGDPHCEQGRSEAGDDQIRAHRLSPWCAAEITEQWLDLV